MNTGNAFLSGYLNAVQQNPDAIALVVDNQAFSYSSLNTITEQIRPGLKNAGEQFIGVLTCGTVYMYASMLAVFLEGKTLVPIQTEWPAERVGELLTASGVSLILNGTGKKHNFLKNVSQIDTSALQENSRQYTRGINPPVDSEQPAYILFTSGSTGNPKGVPVPYRALASFFDYYTSTDEYILSEKDRFLQVYEPGFDVFYFSFLFPLINGASSYTLPVRKGIKSILILQALQEYSITVVSMVPTVLLLSAPLLDRISLPHLRLSFFSGDILYDDLAVKWQNTCPNVTIHNCYGPTETTIVCTTVCWSRTPFSERQYNGIACMGVPFPGTVVSIRNEQGEELPSGKPGELWIAGRQVFNEYLQNKAADNFVIIGDPPAAVKFYKTGDMAHQHENGLLYFHGRKDRQVKINGYRIELEEITAKLRELSDAEAVVLAVPDKQQIHQLVAYFSGLQEDEIKEIQVLLKAKLPAYMLPSKYINVVQWPLNSNGKIDKLKLKEYIQE